MDQADRHVIAWNFVLPKAKPENILFYPSSTIQNLLVFSQLPSYCQSNNHLQLYCQKRKSQTEMYTKQNKTQFGKQGWKSFSALWKPGSTSVYGSFTVQQSLIFYQLPFYLQKQYSFPILLLKKWSTKTCTKLQKVPFGKQACMTLQFMAVSPFNNPRHSISFHFICKSNTLPNIFVKKGTTRTCTKLHKVPLVNKPAWHFSLQQFYHSSILDILSASIYLQK